MKSLREITKSIDSAQALRRAIAMFSEKKPGITLKAIEEHIKTVPDINAQDGNKDSLKTALHIAVKYKVPEAIRLLLAAKARYDICDADKKTALCYAAASDNEAVKKEMFFGLANRATDIIAKEFQYVSDKERAKKENGDMLLQKGKAINDFCVEIESLVTFGIPALFTSDKTKTIKTETAEKAHNLWKRDYAYLARHLVRLVSTSKELSATKHNLNYCGYTGWRLCAELFKQKAIYSGNLNVKILTMHSNLGEHEILLINCKIDSNDRVFIPDSTILCNPFVLNSAERVKSGAMEILCYLIEVRMVVPDANADPDNALPIKLNKTTTSVTFNNFVPDFNNLLCAKKEFSEFVPALQQAVLLSIQNDENAFSFKKYLQDKYCALYVEKEKKGIITNMKKHSQFSVSSILLTTLYDAIQKEKLTLNSKKTGADVTAANSPTAIGTAMATNGSATATAAAGTSSLITAAVNGGNGPSSPTSIIFVPNVGGTPDSKGGEKFKTKK